MRLYCSLTSPYARKVRIVIREKQLPVDVVIVDTGTDSRVSALNPLGKVPVFQRDDGTVLFDSPVIVEYLDAFRAPALIPASGEARWQVLRMAALGDGILDAVVTRVLELRRPGPQQSAVVITNQETKVARALGFAEQQLKNGPWLVGNEQTLADIALTTALGYVDFRYPHEWKSTHPRLAKWFAVMSARAAYTETQPPK